MVKELLSAGILDALGPIKRMYTRRYIESIERIKKFRKFLRWKKNPQPRLVAGPGYIFGKLLVIQEFIFELKCIFFEKFLFCDKL